MKPAMKLTLVGAVLLVALVVAIGNRQGIAHSQEQAPVNSADRKQEGTGEVDRLVDELKARNENLLNHCLEDCESSKPAAQDITGGGFIDKIQPQYPAIARAAHASGDVVVMVVINEEGNVIAAQSISGHPLLQAASVKAAKESTFNPFLLGGRAVKVKGIITYRFVLG